MRSCIFLRSDSVGSIPCEPNDQDSPEIIQVPNNLDTTDPDNEEDSSISLILHLSHITCRIGNDWYLYGSCGFQRSKTR
jgi:hypothetical protein